MQHRVGPGVCPRVAKGDRIVDRQDPAERAGPRPEREGADANWIVNDVEPVSARRDRGERAAEDRQPGDAFAARQVAPLRTGAAIWPVAVCGQRDDLAVVELRESLRQLERNSGDTRDRAVKTM